MKEHAPVVPLYVDVAYNVHGSKAGGVFISSVFGYPNSSTPTSSSSP
ncbi:hypothetical protein V2I01_07890 [Micromonospora sp. BRA006-A]|nr:hypothetical protein [Micromonospora sp. BRA006-A]